MFDFDHVSGVYRSFADNECQGYSDLYFNLAHAVAAKEELVAFLSPLPVIQPNLFLAAIQYLAGQEWMPKSAKELEVFVQRRGVEIATLMKLRRTQTNEVGRCAVLLPALPDGPLALLEVGASAGLCLLLDEFYYDYGDTKIGIPESPVRLRCQTQGVLPLPEKLPQVVWRAGLDLAPVNLRDQTDARWMSSCVFADHVERQQRLQAAMDLGRRREVKVHQGNLVTDLRQLIDIAPDHAQLVVFHSAVLSYVSPQERNIFASNMADASRARDIIWISNESRSVVPEIAALAPPSGPRPFLLGRTTFHRGERRDEFLALAHPHGAELEWLHPRY
ncbi:hypothetical protein ETAA8_65510 [Anatilimnocola aggregata]|uniref:DUF2332 domain-containing protein n=1 Tax=Anatilimnocola aggregata TaxID=2528021 RepID=A0A517YMF2_9BACT|nr:DUF2332 domain-containing protein [Anatilimnocola aggregata]QDU31394.1 hypothetical protein ETAA8_65510 [Anatilimnocola aggregata]